MADVLDRQTFLLLIETVLKRTANHSSLVKIIGHGYTENGPNAWVHLLLVTELEPLYEQGHFENFIREAKHVVKLLYGHDLSITFYKQCGRY